MKIKSIHLQDFKRFTDLTISELPETAKLVVLIGPNGCGKSSLFDALHVKVALLRTPPAMEEWRFKLFLGYWNKQYSLDSGKDPVSSNIRERIKIDFHGTTPKDSESWKRAIYVRSAYRNTPTIKTNEMRSMTPKQVIDEHRFIRLIENDEAVTSNYYRLAFNVLEQVLEQSDDKITLGEFRKHLMEDVSGAIRRLFDDPPLEMLNNLGNPLRDTNFRFNKGKSKRFLYENLSGGEKAVFDLILDLIIKRQEFNDTVFCIDEPDAHLGLRLQGKLLRELYRLILNDCQLWIATHSLGMMRSAYELEKENPGTVVFLNFDKKDFDQRQVIKPSKINRATWENMHQVVLEDLAALIVPDKIILCEGKPGEEGLDAQCYNTIFAEEHPDTLFVSTGGKGEGANYEAVVKAITKADVILLRDKDNLSDQEIREAKTSGKRVLSRTKLEDYLLDEEVLRALCRNHLSEYASKLEELMKLKQQTLKAKSNDAKAIVNDIRMWAIRSLGVQNAGDKPSSFLQDTMAPLIQPDMRTYKELKEDIFG